MSEAPRRLRRTPAGKAPDPLDHKSGLPTSGTTLDAHIRPSPQGSVEVVGGEVVVPGMPSAGEGSVMARYEDLSDTQKPNRPSGGHVPFVLDR